MLQKLSSEVQSAIRSGITITDTAQCVIELVENALDAKSTCIAVRVDLENYMIQVVDNGHGLTKEELDLVGTRYMTNKCNSLSDLTARTEYYGFRGESLASLRETCGVMMLISKVKDSECSYSKVFRANNQIKNATVSAHDRLCAGTTVVVRDFLVNLPVRRARIQPALEMQDIRYCLQILSIINHKVSFTLRNDVTKAVILQTQEYKDIGDALRHHCNLSKDHCLIKVSLNDQPFKLTGYISRETESSGRFQFIYVNKRLVKNKNLYKLIEKGLSKSFYLRNIGKEIKAENDKPKEKPAAVFIICLQCPHIECDFTSDPRKFKVEFRNWDAANACFEKLIEKFLRTESNLKIAAVKSDNNADEHVVADGNAKCNKTVNCNVVYGADIKRQKAELSCKEVVECSTPPMMDTVNNNNNKTIDNQSKFATGKSCEKDKHKPNKSNTSPKLKQNCANDCISNNIIKTELNCNVYKVKNNSKFSCSPKNVQNGDKLDEISTSNGTILEKVQISQRGNISLLNKETNKNKENTNNKLTGKGRQNTNILTPSMPKNKPKNEKTEKLVPALKSDLENPIPFKLRQKIPRIMKRKILSEHITTESESDVTPKRKKGSWDSSASKVPTKPDTSILPFTSREILNNVIKNIEINKKVSCTKFGLNKNKLKDKINYSQRTPNQKIQVNLYRTVKENQKRNTFTLTQQSSIEYCTYGQGYYYKYTDRSKMKRQYPKNIDSSSSHEVCEKLHTMNNKHEISEQGKGDLTHHVIYSNKNTRKLHTSDANMNYSSESIKKHASNNPKYNRNYKQKFKLFSPVINNTNCSKMYKLLNQRCSRMMKSRETSENLIKSSKKSCQIPFGIHIDKIKPNLHNISKYKSSNLICNEKLDVNIPPISPVFYVQDDNAPNFFPNKILLKKSYAIFDGFKTLFESKHKNKNIFFDFSVGKQENECNKKQEETFNDNTLPSNVIDHNAFPSNCNNFKNLDQKSDVERHTKIPNKTSHKYKKPVQRKTCLTFNKNKQEIHKGNQEINDIGKEVPTDLLNNIHKKPSHDYENKIQFKVGIFKKNKSIKQKMKRNSPLLPILLQEEKQKFNFLANQDNITHEGKESISINNAAIEHDGSIGPTNNNYQSSYFDSIPTPTILRKSEDHKVVTDDEPKSDIHCSLNNTGQSVKQPPLNLNIPKHTDELSDKISKSNNCSTFHIESLDENISSQKVNTEVQSFMDTQIESVSRFKVSPLDETLPYETLAVCPVIIETVTDQQQVHQNKSCDSIGTTLAGLDKEIGVEENRNCNEIFDNDKISSEVTKVNNQFGQSDNKLHNFLVLSHSNNDWNIETIPTGGVIYIHKKTGMSSFVIPKADSEMPYQFQNRHWFMPKGTSPLLDLKNYPINNELTKPERTIVQAIVTDNNTKDLARVKWKWSNFKDVENMLSTVSGADPGVEWHSRLSLNKPCVFSNKSLHNAKVIGQVDSKFIAAVMQPNDMTNSFIVLFDQHAVDERVCLENLILGYKKDGELISEEVNPGIETSLNKSERELLMQIMPKIIKFGLKFEVQDDKIFVTALPLCLLKRSKRESEPPSNIITAFLRQLLLSAEEFRGIIPSLPAFLVDIINSEACRGAIKFGDKLTLEECKLLISKLSQCEIPFQCAHGRPVLATLVEVEGPEPEENIDLSKLRRHDKNIVKFIS